MLAKATLTAFTILLLSATITGFAQTAAQTVTSMSQPKVKPKQPPRVVFDVPDDTPKGTAPSISRPSIYDLSPDQIRDKALLDGLTKQVELGHAQTDAGNLEAALQHYRTALSALENTMLGINSYDLRFGIGMVAPAIADTYTALGDKRAKAAQNRVKQWYKCGLMADNKMIARGVDATLCGAKLNFDLFRESES